MGAFTIPARDLADVVLNGSHGPLSLVGDSGGRSLIVGDVSESSLVPSSLSVETEHGTTYLDLYSNVEVVADES